jgi:hypothetical protein
MSMETAGIPEGHILFRCFLRDCPFLVNLNEIFEKNLKKKTEQSGPGRNIQLDQSRGGRLLRETFSKAFPPTRISTASASQSNYQATKSTDDKKAGAWFSVLDQS